MRQRQHGYQSLSRIDGQHLHAYLHVVAQAPAVEHHALRAARAAGGIINQTQRIGIGREMDILRLDAARIEPLERLVYLLRVRERHAFRLIQRTEIHQRNGGFHACQLVVLQFVPYVRTYKQQLRIRVLQQTADIIGLEVLQYTDHHGFITADSQISHCPIGAVTSRNGNLVALLNA